MSKSYLPILVVIIVIFLIVIGAVFYFHQPKIGSKEAALIINYGESKRAFAGKVVEGMTILDALVTSAKAGNFDFDYQEGILKKVDGFERNGKKWSAYLNGVKVQESLDKVLIKAGDKIELKFE